MSVTPRACRVEELPGLAAYVLANVSGAKIGVSEYFHGTAATSEDCETEYGETSGL